jgi:cellulose synthase (UDP-forming)
MAVSTTDLLPSPPTNKEKYAYFGRRHRWMPFFMFASFMGVILALVKLSLKTQATHLLWILVVLLFVYGYTGFRASAWGRRHDLWDHRTLVDQRSGNGPVASVDVFLPSCGEPMDVLRNTYTWVAKLAWEGELTVYVLDDSARPAVESLATSFGFVYLTRPDRPRMKKAGNLAYGYARSTGDVILILDADFVPRSDMLTELVPYFDDAAVGIAQSPQYFDLYEEFNWIQRSSGAVQQLFYRFIQPARDRVDGAICVGTNALYRRAALDTIGGMPQISHSEDVYTGVELMRAGYIVRYVPLVLAKGLSPDTFSGYTNMVYRWCTGSISLMVDPNFRKAPLRPAQRLCFWAGFIFYITSALAVIVGTLPGLLMAWCFPGDVRPTNVIPLLPSIIASMVVFPAMFGTLKFIELVRLNIVSGYCFLLSIWDFARGRTAAWVPTGAVKASPVERKVRYGLIWWGGLTQLVMFAGIGRGIADYGIGRYWVMLLMAVVDLWAFLPLALPGQGLREAPARRRTRRTAPATEPVPVASATG